MIINHYSQHGRVPLSQHDAGTLPNGQPAPSVYRRREPKIDPELRELTIIKEKLLDLKE
jgi:hypothetical protein